MTLAPALSPSLAGELFGAERAMTLIRAAWPSAVGARLAQRSEPLALDGRTLLVRVPDERWRKILHRLRREILARLREVAGHAAPSALGFVEARPSERAPDPPGAPRPREPEAAPAAAPPELAAAAAAISDPELRGRFLESAGRYLARSRARRAPQSSGAAPANRR